MGLKDETQQGNKGMASRKRIRTGLELAAGALVFAALMWGVLGAPGFLSDRDSTAP